MLFFYHTAFEQNVKLFVVLCLLQATQDTTVTQGTHTKLAKYNRFPRY
jgi:hypothetical protein